MSNDLYSNEQLYMASRGIVAHAKQGNPHLLRIPLVVSFVTVLTMVSFGTALGSALVVGALITLVLELVLLYWTMLRVTVSSRTVQIQLGMLGLTISLSSLTHAEVVEKTFPAGGKQFDGIPSYSAGTGSRSLLLHYEENGEAKKVYVQIDDAHHLAKSINAAAAHVRFSGVGATDSPPE